MAYQEGTATSQEDFVDKLRQFAVNSAGFTLGEFDTTNDRAAVSNGTIFVQIRWDNTTGIAFFQSTGFAGGTAPGSQAGDSGNGDTSGPITSERRLSDIGNGPYVKHWFFGSSAQPYVHAVLEYAAGRFRHVSFGLLTKFGTWTGGAYCGATEWDLVQDQTHPIHGLLLDGHSSGVDGGTVRIEPTFPDVGATVKWGVMTSSATPGNDTAGNPRVRLGGSPRDSFLTNAIDGIPVNLNNGFVPMWPIPIWLNVEATPKRYRLLGAIPDVRVLNGKFLLAAEELVVGADTWKVFPWAAKTTAGATGERSGNMFLAYKKVV